MVYASTILTGDQGRNLVAEAVKALLSAHDVDAQVLWSLSYEQHAQSPALSAEASELQLNILKFQDAPLDYAFDDAIIENVQTAWQKILPGADDFMVFRERGDDAGEEAADDEETSMTA